MAAATKTRKPAKRTKKAEPELTPAQKAWATRRARGDTGSEAAQKAVATRQARKAEAEKAKAKEAKKAKRAKSKPKPKAKQPAIRAGAARRVKLD